MLADIKRISSVSGGSITAGVLALNGANSVSAGAAQRSTSSRSSSRRCAPRGETIDADSVILGALLPGSISDRIATAYDEHLFHGATLQDLPDEPRFVINATNVQSGALWRFMKPYMRDYRVGEVRNPTVPLAQAVAASSAFPPVLSPFELRLEDSDFDEEFGDGPAARPFTTAGASSPTAACTTISASRRPGSGIRPSWSATPAARSSRRRSPRPTGRGIPTACSNLIDSQVRSLRKRQVINSFKSNARKGPIGASAPISRSTDCRRARLSARSARWSWRNCRRV